MGSTRAQQLQSITVYPRYTNRLTGQVKPMRRVLHRCIFRDEQTTIARTKGVVLGQGIFVQMFYEEGITYLPPDEWAKLADATPIMDIEEVLAPFYTIEVGGNTNTVIIDHEVNIDIPMGTSAQVSAAELELLRIPVARRAQSVENNFRGSLRVQHLLVRA